MWLPFGAHIIYADVQKHSAMRRASLWSLSALSRARRFCLRCCVPERERERERCRKREREREEEDDDDDDDGAADDDADDVDGASPTAHR